MKALTSLFHHRALLPRTGHNFILCRYSNKDESANQVKHKLKNYSNGYRKFHLQSTSGRNLKHYSDWHSNEHSGQFTSNYLDSRHDTESDSYSEEGARGEEESDINRDLLIPKEVPIKIFNKKPANEQQKRRFLLFRTDVIRLSKTGTTKSLETCFRMYLAENPRSHFISSQVIKQMSTAFSIAGDIDRCEELLQFYRKLKRNKGKDQLQDNIHALIVSSYLLSLVCSPDTDRARKLAANFLNDANKRPHTVHPIVRNTLANIMRELGLYSELEDSLSVAGTARLTPGSLLDTVQEKLLSGHRDQAVQLFEEHMNNVDTSHVNADHFAQLAKVMTGMYEDPAYKQISLFCDVPKGSLKNFSHFSTPLLKNSTLCKNYELVLHIAHERQNMRLFRIIGGRNGLTRQLQHVSSQEYIVMVQYMCQVCQHFDIGLDKPFWKSLFNHYFKLSRRPCDYNEIRELHAAIPFYPLTSELWCRTVLTVQLQQLAAVLKALVRVGLMDDSIYSAFVTRTQNNDLLSDELKQLSGFYSLVTNSDESSQT